MPSHCTHPPISQREISNAADAAARLYHETTPEDRRSALEIWDTMTKAQDRLIKSIRSRNFKKYISVAHKDNGDDFFHEVFPLPVIQLLCSYLCLYILGCFSYFFLWHSFFLQIDRHFSTFLVPDMAIEKLQKVATTHVDASFKARWLRWWNSPVDVKTQNMFPSNLPLHERVLDDWLHKAYLWAHVLQTWTRCMLVRSICNHI